MSSCGCRANKLAHPCQWSSIVPWYGNKKTIATTSVDCKGIQSERKPVLNGCVLLEPIYITFLKWEKCGGEEHSRHCQRETGQVMKAQQRVLGGGAVRVLTVAVGTWTCTEVNAHTSRHTGSCVENGEQSPNVQMCQYSIPSLLSPRDLPFRTLWPPAVIWSSCSPGTLRNFLLCFPVSWILCFLCLHVLLIVFKKFPIVS